MTIPFLDMTLEAPSLNMERGLSLFSLAPQMDHVPSLERQEALVQAFQTEAPDFKATFKRFPSRAFKRLSLKDAETLLLDLVQDAYLADVLHLHLDWYCYLGRFSQYQAMGLWMHVFQLFRDKPLFLFGHEVPTFLNNPLMVKERAIWQQWFKHFKETPHHQLVLHQPSMKTAWLDVGFPEERLLILPNLLHLKEERASFPIQPTLFHTIKDRFSQGQKKLFTKASSKENPFILGFIPHDEDNDSVARLIDAFLALPNHVVLLVMGGSHAQRPEFRWEHALLEAIQTHGLADRVLMTGRVQPDEEVTYLNVCDVVYVAHHHQNDALQRTIYNVLQEGKPLFLPAESETVQGLAVLFKDAWQTSAIVQIASREDLLQACASFEKRHPDVSQEAVLNAMGLEALTARYLQQYQSLLSIQ